MQDSKRIYSINVSVACLNIIWIWCFVGVGGGVVGAGLVGGGCGGL